MKTRRRTGSAVAAAIGSQGPSGLAGRGPDGDGFRRQTPLQIRGLSLVDYWLTQWSLMRRIP